MAGLEEFQGPFSKLRLATRLGLLVLERALCALCQCLRDTHRNSLPNDHRFIAAKAAEAATFKFGSSWAPVWLSFSTELGVLLVSKAAGWGSWVPWQGVVGDSFWTWPHCTSAH